MKARIAIAVAALFLFAAPSANAAFGFQAGPEGFSVKATEENGTTAARKAGAHPFSLTTEVNLNLAPGGKYSDGDLKDLRIDLAAGMIENPQVVAKCTIAQFHTPRNSPFQESLSGESCPNKSQVGIVTVKSSFGGGSERTFGVFNLEPEPGSPAQLGFNAFGMPVVLDREIDSTGGEYRFALVASNVPQLLNISGLEMTLWGNPWLVQHDLQRGDCLNETDPASGFNDEACSTGVPVSNPPNAYLTLPTSCGGIEAFTASATSWQQPGVVTRNSLPLGIEECDLKSFKTIPLIQLGTDRAASASGLDFTLEVDQSGLVNNVTKQGFLMPGIKAPSQVQKAVVTLPEGMTVNPSVASGLGTCSPAQYAAESKTSPPGAGCPNVSKIGEMTVESPLLEKPLRGGLFLATPYDNPFGSLVAIYLVAKDETRGIMVKVAGEVKPNEATGRLVTTFDQLPQLPYSHLNVHFRDGQRSPLATPPTCGLYSAGMDLNPWISPNEIRHTDAFFTLASGIGGGPCPSGQPGFRPKSSSGTLNRNTGSFSPFYLHLTRSDEEQEITSYSAVLPKGLLGSIKGVPFCPESSIAAAARNSGFAETERPSCPEAAKIGKTTAGYGLGNVLAYAPGNLYLAGPYHGSPLSIVAVDSATVGPFDLGVIIVRSAIRVDPITAQISIDSAGSDPIPHIIKGIPLHLRDIRVYIDRPNFMVNPTSCDQFSVTSTLNGSGASFGNPADDSLASTSNPFQVSFCTSLEFKPQMDFRLKGGTTRGKYPSLTATVTPRPGDANIGAAQVTLPPSLFLAQNHLDTICGKPQSAAGKCPAGSIYGRARAITPMMDEPLEGPVYLRASGNKLPDLVAQLSGRGIRIDVVGRIDSKNGGMRATYETLPDAPVSKFVLTLDGGKKHGLLVNSDNACKSFFATSRMAGQNNKGAISKSPVIHTGCKKAKKKNKGAKAKKKGGKK